MDIQSGRLYLAMWSIVVDRDRYASVNLDNLRASVIEDLSRHHCQVLTGVGQTLVNVTEINNVLLPNTFEVDIVVRFRCTGNVPSTELDNAVAYSWNRTAGRPMIPSGDPNNAGRLFSVCNASATRDAQPISVVGAAINDRPYRQLCSRFTVIQSEAGGQVTGTGGVIDSVTAPSIIQSTNPDNVGRKQNDFQEYRQLATGLWADIARFFNGDHDESGGMNGNDVKILAYGTLGLLGLLVLSKVVKEIKRV